MRYIAYQRWSSLVPALSLGVKLKRMNLLHTSVCSLSSCKTSSLGDMIHHMPALSQARWTSGVMALTH